MKKGLKFCLNGNASKTKYKQKGVSDGFFRKLLIFKLQNEVLKVNDNYMRWKSPKIDLKLNFLNLENQSFENVSFS